MSAVYKIQSKLDTTYGDKIYNTALQSYLFRFSPNFATPYPRVVFQLRMYGNNTTHRSAKVSVAANYYQRI